MLITTAKNELLVYDLRNPNHVTKLLGLPPPFKNMQIYNYSENELTINHTLKSLIGKGHFGLSPLLRALKVVNYTLKRPIEIDMNSTGHNLKVLHLETIIGHPITVTSIDLPDSESVLWISDCTINGAQINLKAYNIYMKNVTFSPSAKVNITVYGSSGSLTKRGRVLDNVRGNINFTLENTESIPGDPSYGQLVVI